MESRAALARVDLSHFSNRQEKELIFPKKTVELILDELQFVTKFMTDLWFYILHILYNVRVRVCMCVCVYSNVDLVYILIFRIFSVAHKIINRILCCVCDFCHELYKSFEAVCKYNCYLYVKATNFSGLLVLM